MTRIKYSNAERGLENLAMAVSYLKEASYDLEEMTTAGLLGGALCYAIGGLSQTAENLAEWVLQTAMLDEAKCESEPEQEQEQEQESICEHPHVSRSWIGYSGYAYCNECGKIIKEEDD